ncbi:MAG: hypothetical protein ACE5LU_26475, partial [Anaerolineae bacterium]
EDDQINALANIAVIGSNINIRISAKDPMHYIERYRISNEKLAQQFIPTDRNEFSVEKYQSFLKNRAKRLTEQANMYLASLRKEIEL